MTTLKALGWNATEEHIPVPQEHREQKDVLIAKQTEATITYTEEQNRDACITTDTVVEVLE